MYLFLYTLLRFVQKINPMKKKSTSFYLIQRQTETKITRVEAYDQCMELYVWCHSVQGFLRSLLKMVYYYSI
jgi:hypothetical protein